MIRASNPPMKEPRPSGSFVHTLAFKSFSDSKNSVCWEFRKLEGPDGTQGII
jgi:hypothetical protein